MTSLNSLIESDQSSITQVRQDLKTRGYAFIKLSDDFIHQVDECLLEVEDFFRNNLTEKEKYFREPLFGYFKVQHKEVFRFLTGSRIGRQKFPVNFDGLLNLTKTLDEIVPRLASIIFPGIEEVVEGFIPFNKWGMIDAVQYFNEPEKMIKKDAMNIVEHFDAGLLAFSFRSTEPGLQLKNEFGEWIDAFVDDSIAVLWTGHAVRKYDSDHPEGVHRVITSNKSRIGLWYEICCYSQERNDILKGKFVGDPYELELIKKEGYEPVRDGDGIIKEFKEIDGGKTLVGKFIGEVLTTGMNKTFIGYPHSGFVDRSENVFIGPGDS